MSKKLIVIMSVALTLALVVLVGYYLVIKNNGGDQSGPISGFKSFFPFGGNETPTGGVVNNPTPNQEEESEQKNFTQKLRKLSIEQVSGAGTLDIKAGTVVRYIEKATGHIFEIELFSPNQNRISNTTIPKVYDAVWLNKNNSLITRYLREDDQTVDTYSITLKNVSTTTENTISGIALPPNINDVSVSGNSLFYLIKTTDSSTGFVSNFDGSKKKQIWNSAIKELLSQYVKLKTVALTTKPAPNTPGFLYFVDTGTGQVRKILGDIVGLSTLVSQDGNSVLYLEQGNSAQMTVFDQKNKTYTKNAPATFPEKCVWSNKNKNIVYCAVPRGFIDGGSLESWYKGSVSYTDDIW